MLSIDSTFLLVLLGWSIFAPCRDARCGLLRGQDRRAVMTPAEVIEENNRQKYLARRRQATRALGADKKATGDRRSTQGSGARRDPGGSVPGRVPAKTSRSRSMRAPAVAAPLPWLLAVVVAASAGVFALAVYGAFRLVQEIFG